MPKIPKIIHFIWVGPNPLPDKYIENILRWAQQNPSFQVNLWVDRKSAVERAPAETKAASSAVESDFEKGLKVQKAWYTTAFPKAARNILGADATPEQVQNLLGRIMQREITDEKMISAAVRYEIDRLQPNYGAASDLLRYAILTHFGGCYFDTDVRPGTQPLESVEKLFTEEATKFLHYFDISIKSSAQNAAANDTFVCAPRNPTMRMIEKFAQHNYHIQTSLPLAKAEEKNPIVFGRYKIHNKEFPNRDSLFLSCFERSCAGADQVISAYCYGNLELFNLTTLFKTGPYCISLMLKMDLSRKKMHALGPELRCVDIASDKTWCDRRLNTANAAEAIEHAVASVIFEVNHQGSLRLDYHIDCIFKSLSLSGAKPPNPTEIINQFLSRLEEKMGWFFCRKVKIAQLTFHYPQTLIFYKQHKLLEKTLLFPKEWNETTNNKIKLIISLVCTEAWYDYYKAFGQGKVVDAKNGEILRQGLIRSFEFLDGLLESCAQMKLRCELTHNPKETMVVHGILNCIRDAVNSCMSYKDTTLNTECKNFLQAHPMLLDAYPTLREHLKSDIPIVASAVAALPTTTAGERKSTLEGTRPS